MPVHHTTTHTHIRSLIHPEMLSRIAMVLVLLGSYGSETEEPEEKPSQIWEEHTKLHTDSNPSSGLWTADMALIYI